MPKKYRKRSSKRNSHVYRKMTDDEIRTSREKIGISAVKIDNTHTVKECQAHDCTEPAKSKCSYCGREFCNTHLDPRMAATAKFIWSLDKSDYEKYNKYQEDWQRKDGHPCVPYSEKWNRDHDERINYKSVPKWGGIPTQNRAYTSDKEWTKATYPDSYNSKPHSKERMANEKPKQNKSNRKIIIAAIFIVVILILGFLILNALTNNGTSNNNKSLFQTTIRLLGTQSDPFQPNLNHTIKWQGSGYYLIPVNVPATGLVEGTDLLSNESQAIGYNLWIVQLYNQTTVNTTSTVTPTTTIMQSTLSTIYYTTTIYQSLYTINSQWITNFNTNLSTHRNPSLKECSTLDQFARVRFNTSTEGSNWEISHYGFTNDSTSFLGGKYYYYTGEVVLYPNGYTPSDYIPYLMSEAPGHYNLLVDENFSYYGYYIGQAPTFGVYQPCSVTEIPGPNINELQFYQEHGCRTTVENVTWVVIDLSLYC